MANTHHTGIPMLQWTFEYPPCTPSVTIVADKNPFCLGDSVTFTPTFACVDDVTITAYGWVVNGSIQSTSAEPFVTNTLTNGNSVYMFFITSIGQTYFSNVITMQETTEGCPTLIKYGLLYNGYAVADTRKITSNDTFRITLKADFDTLITYLGGSTVAGGKLKEIGFTYFLSPNTGATNEVNFNGRGSGTRFSAVGTFQGFMQEGVFICSDSYAGSYPYEYKLSRITDDMTFHYRYKYVGNAIRIVRIATAPEQLLADGTACAHYIGNDGKIYRTVKIGTQVWLACNLAETKFHNGDWIPGFDGGVYTPISNEAWAALTTAGMCAYDNDWNNV